MKTVRYFAVATAVAALSACGRPEPAANENAAAPQGQAQLHSGSGTVESISGDQVTIAHGPIESAGWAAMTMTFTAPDGLGQGVSVGDRVDFGFHQDDGTYVLSSLRKR